MQTNRNSTRRSLLVSATALILSIAMLVGTTFAWFTDSASTGVNKIQAGNLDVDLEMSTDGTSWESAEGKTLQFKKATAAPGGEQVLWEPGCTYELPQLRVVNKGNLALKYKIQITGIQGDAKLNEVIDWTIGDAAIDLTEGHLSAGQPGTAFTIKGHMQETAGNEYKNLTIDGISITVYATQDTVEYDSNNNAYDTNATYLNTDAQGNNYFISNANELVYFAKSVNVDGETYAGKTVKLTADIDLAGKLWIPVGQTQVSSFQGTFDGQGHTIKNMTVNYTGTNSNYACGLFGWIELHNGDPIVIQNVKFDNANVTGIKYTGVVAGYANGASGAEIKNCVVTNSTVTSNSKNAGGIIGYMGTGVLTGNTVSGCTISAKYDVGGIANSVEPAVTFTKNKVENTNIYYAEDQAYDAAGIFVCGKVSSVTIDITNTNSNVTVNKLVKNATDLETAVANGGDVVMANNVTLTGKVITTNGIPEAYGKNVGVAQYGGTLDGNGNTLTETGSSAYVIVTHGGTIKNLTIEGGGRGIVIYAPKEDVIIDKVVIDGPGYAINTAEHNGHDLIVTNSTVNGWTSLAGLDSVSFTNCKLGENSTKCWQSSGYDAEYDRLIRPYGQASFTGCTFEKKFCIDLSKLANGNKVTLTNCNCEDVVLTAENYENYITVERPDWATSIADCIVFN